MSDETETEVTSESEEWTENTLVSSSLGGELLTPEECAQRTGNTYQLRKAAQLHLRTGSAVGFSPRHLAAAQLHGWNAHQRATSKPFRMALEDYQAALKAVSTLTPHQGALSEYATKTEAK